VTAAWALAALGALLLPAALAAQTGPFGADGAKAYQMARSAGDDAQAAQQEGTTAYQSLKELAPPAREGEPLRRLQDDGAAAHEALTGYRKRAMESSGEALSLLAELTRGAATTSGSATDQARREVYEQKALLAAHEAGVMAARARTEAERLRAILAEARGVVASVPSPGRAPASRPEPPPRTGQDVEVPNLIGARLDGALRDLQTAGLRLGTTAGPRDGFIVKQTPAAGTRLPRQGAVSVTLSATAAGSTVITPR
jgi:PASTA domain